MTELQALATALMFGIAYNALIVRWSRSQWGDGFTALWVVIGVMATLLISAFVTRSPLARLHLTWHGEVIVLSNAQHAAWFELKFFIATGVPMFFGSLWRYINLPLENLIERDE
jgi:hypothetical protein